MKLIKDQKGRGRVMTKRALVLSLVVYVVGIALTIFGADQEMKRYAGFALIAVGAIALATVFIDGLISISTGLRTAIILAILGIIAYAIWSGYAA